MGEIFIIGDHSLKLSNTISEWSNLQSISFLWTSKLYSRAAYKFYYFSAVLEWYFSNFEKYIGARTMDQ